MVEYELLVRVYERYLQSAGSYFATKNITYNCDLKKKQKAVTICNRRAPNRRAPNQINVTIAPEVTIFIGMKNYTTAVAKM